MKRRVLSRNFLSSISDFLTLGFLNRLTFWIFHLFYIVRRLVLCYSLLYSHDNFIATSRLECQRQQSTTSTF